MRRGSDSLLAALSVLHGAALLIAPSALLVAIGIWWNSNTIAHHFIHRPFFRSRSLNRIFSVYQSVLTGIPQTLWRERHLAHHAGVHWHMRWSTPFLVETLFVAGLWTTVASSSSAFFALTYAPGYLGGLMLCALQGHYEHARGTTSHYGRLYNLLCFNDGYHAEHHASPGVHWSELPARTQAGVPASRWPALLRWLDAIDLERLEQVVLRSVLMQRLVVAVHRRAFRVMLAEMGPIRRAVIVGGGLFPRTALILHELAPSAEIVVIDASRRNLAIAQDFVARRGGTLRQAVRFTHARFTADTADDDVDLVIVPLAYQGDREAIYRRPPARIVLVHDWIWRVRGRGRVVSVLLLKRLNLVGLRFGPAVGAAFPPPQGSGAAGRSALRKDRRRSVHLPAWLRR